MTITLILTILQAALSALAGLKDPIGTDATLAAAFIAIISQAQAAYQAQTGQPLNLANIPLETPVGSTTPPVPSTTTTTVTKS